MLADDSRSPMRMRMIRDLRREGNDSDQFLSRLLLISAVERDDPIAACKIPIVLLRADQGSYSDHRQAPHCAWQTGNLTPATNPLFNGHRFGEVARLIDVRALEHGDVIGQ